MNSHVDKENGATGLAADFSYLDENELAAVTTFAAHIKLRGVHHSFFRQIADALEGRVSVFKPAEPLKADASEIEGAAASAQKQLDELKASAEGNDRDGFSNQRKPESSDEKVCRCRRTELVLDATKFDVCIQSGVNYERIVIKLKASEEPQRDRTPSAALR